MERCFRSLPTDPKTGVGPSSDVRVVEPLLATESTRDRSSRELLLEVAFAEIDCWEVLLRNKRCDCPSFFIPKVLMSVWPEDTEPLPSCRPLLCVLLWLRKESPVGHGKSRDSNCLTNKFGMFRSSGLVGLEAWSGRAKHRLREEAESDETGEGGSKARSEVCARNVLRTSPKRCKEDRKVS